MVIYMTLKTKIENIKLRNKLHQAVRKIAYNDLYKNSRWLDAYTFVSVLSPCNNTRLNDVFTLLNDKYNDSIDIHNSLNDDEWWIDCEYWSDDNTFHYIMVFTDTSIDITNIIKCSHLNRLLYLLATER